MTIHTDVVIVGAGPVGLFQIFELGLLGIQAHIIEALDKPGGQCAELYPDKPIYDIPALPVIGAQQLVDNLMEQARPFDPVFHFGEQAQILKRDLTSGKWYLKTSQGSEFLAKAVIVAGGVGAFEPVRLKVPGIEHHIGSSVFYTRTVQGSTGIRCAHADTLRTTGNAIPRRSCYRTTRCIV